nr:polycystin-1-like protein 3 isoform X1 [Nerophis lumbriciformis]
MLKIPLLLGFLGLWATVNSMLVNGVTQIPIKAEEDVFPEAVSDEFLVEQVFVQSESHQGNTTPQPFDQTSSGAESRNQTLVEDSFESSASGDGDEELSGDYSTTSPSDRSGSSTTETALFGWIISSGPQAAPSSSTANPSPPTHTTDAPYVRSGDNEILYQNSTTHPKASEDSIEGLYDDYANTSLNDWSNSSTTEAPLFGWIVSSGPQAARSSPPSHTTDAPYFGSGDNEIKSSTTHPKASVDSIQGLSDDYANTSPRDWSDSSTTETPLFGWIISSGPEAARSSPPSQTTDTPYSGSGDSDILHRYSTSYPRMTQISPDVTSSTFVGPDLVDEGSADDVFGSGQGYAKKISKKKRLLSFSPIQGGKTPHVLESEDSATTEQHKGHVTPDWIIILGFVVGVAALVMLCAAIATRDKWNGPNQAKCSKTKAGSTQKDAEAEMFLEKEKPRENGKAEEYTVIPLDELPEKYSH